MDLATVHFKKCTERLSALLASQIQVSLYRLICYMTSNVCFFCFSQYTTTELSGRLKELDAVAEGGQLILIKMTWICFKQEPDLGNC